MQKWPSSTLCPPISMVTGTTHSYPVAIRSVHVICAQALTVAAPGVGHQEQLGSLRIELSAHVLPPGQDAVGSKLRRVVVDPHADPTLIVTHIIDSIGNRFAQFRIRKIV